MTANNVKKHGFSKKLRLASNSEFKAVIAKRHRFCDNSIVFYIAANGLEYSRLGVSISKAAGPAVIRNRFKRLVREAFRINRDNLPAGYDYVVIGASKSARNLVFEEIKQMFLRLAGKLSEARNI